MKKILKGLGIIIGVILLSTGVVHAANNIYQNGNNVGIGTTSPYSTLSVSGQTVAQNFIATSTTATSTFSGGIIGPNNFTVVRSTGYVGIGDSAPASALSVSGYSPTGNPLATFTNTSFGGGNSLIQINGNSLDQTGIVLHDDSGYDDYKIYIHDGGLRINDIYDNVFADFLTGSGYGVLDGSITFGMPVYIADLNLAKPGTSGQVTNVLSLIESTSGGGTNTGTGLLFQGTNGGNGLDYGSRIYMGEENGWTSGPGRASNKGYLVFQTRDGTGVNVLNEKARFTSQGLFGIGTSSPWAKLSISNYSTTTSSMPLFAISSSTGTGATSTPFIVTSTGRVGIGTTSPSNNSVLDINGYVANGNKKAFIEATLGDNSGGEAQSGAASTFTTVDLDTRAYDPTSLFDTANHWYTVPVSGIYKVVTKLRLVDGADVSAGTPVSYGQGADTSAIDSTNFLWFRSAYDTTRNGSLNVRTSHFNKGDHIQMFFYMDQVMGISNADMTVELLYAD